MAAEDRTVVVLFDLDGTLVSLGREHDELEALRSRILALHADFGVSPQTNSILGMLSAARSSSLVFADELTQMIDEEEVRWAQAAERVLSDSEVDRFAQSVLAARTLVGIVTSNGRPCVDALFDKGILRREEFPIVVTHSEVASLKPAPDMIFRAVKEAGVDDSATVCVVGDSRRDFDALRAFATRSGMRSLFVPVGEVDLPACLAPVDLFRAFDDLRQPAEVARR